MHSFPSLYILKVEGGQGAEGLFKVKQRQGESLRSFVNRWQLAASKCRDFNKKIALAAFTEGLVKGKFLFRLNKKFLNASYDEILYVGYVVVIIWLGVIALEKKFHENDVGYGGNNTGGGGPSGYHIVVFSGPQGSLDDLSRHIPWAKTWFHSLIPNAISETWLDDSFVETFGEDGEIKEVGCLLDLVLCSR
ncbi:hypothetical protein ACLB2K_047107 [Fragaria x ananassa]